MCCVCVLYTLIKNPTAHWCTYCMLFLQRKCVVGSQKPPWQLQPSHHMPTMDIGGCRKASSILQCRSVNHYCHRICIHEVFRLFMIVSYSTCPCFQFICTNHRISYYRVLLKRPKTSTNLNPMIFL